MATKKIDYKALNQELEDILARLQTDLDIEEAVQAYERGVTIAKQLETYLKEAENKVTTLKKSWET